MVGKPYMVKGKRYYPKDEPSYDRSGVASWYGSAFHGRRTASGETYDPDRLSAAHATLPLPSYVRVTNLENGSSVSVRVNDRGPYHGGRLIDLSSKAADMLDLKHRGTASVRVQYVGRPGLGGNDMAFLMASHVKKGRYASAFSRKAQVKTKAQLASNQPTKDHLGNTNHFFVAQYRKFAGNASSASGRPRTSASDASMGVDVPDQAACRLPIASVVCKTALSPAYVSEYVAPETETAERLNYRMPLLGRASAKAVNAALCWRRLSWGR